MAQMSTFTFFWNFTEETFGVDRILSKKYQKPEYPVFDGGGQISEKIFFLNIWIFKKF